MKDPKDPVQQLTDTLTLLRVEIADVKNRQITEKQLKILHAALEKTTVQVGNVAKSAGEGAQHGVARLTHEMGQVSQNMEDSTHRAIRGFSEAVRVIHDSYLSKKNIIYLLLIFSTLFGFVLGAFMTVRVGDYKIAQDFGKTIKGSEADWFCKQAGGKIYVQDHGNFCGIFTNR